MDGILRDIENLSRPELFWLMSYLDGRLRALPPEDMKECTPLPSDVPGTAKVPSENIHVETTTPSLAPLSERIDSLNHSLDPWERTGAAPQGWADHLRQSVVPIHGYIQLRPHSADALPVFGVAHSAASCGTVETTVCVKPTPKRTGKASPSVSIFARDPLCKFTCRHCRCRPCDIGCEHDDHTCYDCEQRLLYPEEVPWQHPVVPACPSWCTQCVTQRCAVRGPHDLHLCMDCEYRLAKCPTPGGGGDPWAAPA